MRGRFPGIDNFNTTRLCVNGILFEIHNNFSCITAICYTDFFLFQENVDVKYMHNKLTVQNTVHISILSCSKIYIYMTD